MIISKEIAIDYGHCLPPAHFGFCTNLHGHRGRIKCFFEGEVVVDKTSKENGMVMDFSICKKIMLKEIYDVLDHGFAIWSNEEEDLTGFYDSYGKPITTVDFIIDRNEKVLLLDKPPTAEVLADYFFDKIAKRLKRENTFINIVELHWYETPNNVAIKKVEK